MSRPDKLYNSRFKLLFVAAILILFSISSSSQGGGQNEANAAALSETTVPNTIYLSSIAFHDDTPRCSSLVAPGPFGVQMYGDTSPNSPYYSYYKDSGTSWVRAPVSWSWVEPTNTIPSEYNWSRTDRVAAAANHACRNMLITHYGAPSWAASAPGGPLDRAPLAELAQYIKALVERYDADGIDDAPGSPKVEYFEFYNEPDEGFVPGGGRWGNDGDKYAEMLKAVYPAVKEANPNAKVVFGGIAYEWFRDQIDEPGPFVRSFLDDVLAAGGGPYFDVMAFHHYPLYAGLWTPRGLGVREKTDFMRSKLAEYGQDKPVIISEMGWHSNETNIAPYGTPEYQARFVVELLTESLAARVPIAIWFSLSDPGGFYPFENGLVANQAPPVTKPAYTVFQTITGQLGSATYERLLPRSETGSDDLFVHQFRNNQSGATVYVAWVDPIDSEQVVPFRLRGSTVTVYDMFGTATTINDTDDGKKDSRVTVQISARPVYIHMP